MTHNVMHKACLLCSRKKCVDPFQSYINNTHFYNNLIVLVDLKAMIRLFQNKLMQAVMPQRKLENHTWIQNVQRCVHHIQNPYFLEFRFHSSVPGKKSVKCVNHNHIFTTGSGWVQQEQSQFPPTSFPSNIVITSCFASKGVGEAIKCLIGG